MPAEGAGRRPHFLSGFSTSASIWKANYIQNPSYTCVWQKKKKKKLFFPSFPYFIYVCIYIYRRRQWHPTPVLLPGKSCGWRSLVGCSPWGRKQSDTTERLHFHFSLSCIGEGNGNPLQCSWLENPRDRGAWWAAVFGVAQSRTQLKRLSSSIYICMYALLFCITCPDFTNREIQ